MCHTQDSGGNCQRSSLNLILVKNTTFIVGVLPLCHDSVSRNHVIHTNRVGILCFCTHQVARKIGKNNSKIQQNILFFSSSQPSKSFRYHQQDPKMKLSWTLFKNIGLDIVNNSSQYGFQHTDHNITQTARRDFITFFGVNWTICERVWNLLDEYGLYQKTHKPEHLMWTLLFLRVYSNERVHATLVGTTTKTFRKWTWRVLEEIALLEPHLVSACLIFTSHFQHLCIY